MILWILNWYGKIVHRLRVGGWCDHKGCWGDWEVIDLGRNKVRHCRCCGWTEFAL